MEEKLTYFYNVGESLAKKLLSKLIELKLINVNNDYTLMQLRKILKNKLIFNDLPIATQTDLLNNPLRVIPRPIIALIDSEINKCLQNTKIKYNIAGSYIRGKSSSGDIDMVLCTDIKKEKTWDFFKEKINTTSKYIKFFDPFAKGDDKVATLIQVDLKKSGLFKKYPEFKKIANKQGKVNVKIDIFLSTSEDYVFAMLFAIGSGMFNILMRSVAKKKGYLLNHRGLYKKNNETLVKVPLKTEKEIFDLLNIKYRTPEQRIK